MCRLPRKMHNKLPHILYDTQSFGVYVRRESSALLCTTPVLQSYTYKHAVTMGCAQELRFGDCITKARAHLIPDVHPDRVSTGRIVIVVGEQPAPRGSLETPHSEYLHCALHNLCTRTDKVIIINAWCASLSRKISGRISPVHIEQKTKPNHRTNIHTYSIARTLAKITHNQARELCPAVDNNKNPSQPI